MILNLQTSPEVNIPFLYEYWNWVGDTSILPTKWYELLKKHDQQGHTSIFKNYTREFLIGNYVRNSKFDPNGFFFITTRSEVVSGVLVWPLDGERCEFVALAAMVSHRDRETAQAVVSLALNYAVSKGFRVAEYRENE